MTEQEIIGEILAREGWPAFTDHPADRGGPTKGGITLASWREYSKNPAATAADVAAITEEQARDFYHFRHIEGPRFAEILDDALREIVIDAGVLHGVPQSAMWLQQGVGVKADGKIGPLTLAAVNAADPLGLFLWMAAQRARKCGRLVSSDRELARAREAGFVALQAVNAAGWNNRVAGFLEAAARRLAGDRTPG
jgi:lysozyme family protein